MHVGKIFGEGKVDRVWSRKVLGQEESRCLEPLPHGAWVITGLKVSLPYALVGTVIGEFMSANRGIGFIIAQASGLFDTTSVFTGLIVLAIVGALINSALKLLEGWLLRWRD